MQNKTSHNCTGCEDTSYVVQSILKGLGWAETEVDRDDPVEIFYKAMIPHISHCVVCIFGAENSLKNFNSFLVLNIVEKMVFRPNDHSDVQPFNLCQSFQMSCRF